MKTLDLLFWGIFVVVLFYLVFMLYLASHGICEDLQFLPVTLSMQRIAKG